MFSFAGPPLNSSIDARPVRHPGWLNFFLTPSPPCSVVLIYLVVLTKISWPRFLRWRQQSFFSSRFIFFLFIFRASFSGSASLFPFKLVSIEVNLLPPEFCRAPCSFFFSEFPPVTATHPQTSVLLPPFVALPINLLAANKHLLPSRKDLLLFYPVPKETFSHHKSLPPNPPFFRV